MSVPVMTVPFTLAVAVRMFGSWWSDLTTSAGMPKGPSVAACCAAEGCGAPCCAASPACWACAAIGIVAIANAANEVEILLIMLMLSVTKIACWSLVRAMGSRRRSAFARSG